MAWAFKRLPNGEIEAHDGTRVRAVICHKRKLWYVQRVILSSGGEYLSSGDDFRTLRAAKDFCANRPGVWGC